MDELFEERLSSGELDDFGLVADDLPFAEPPHRSRVGRAWWAWALAAGSLAVVVSLTAVFMKDHPVAPEGAGDEKTAAVHASVDRREDSLTIQKGTTDYPDVPRNRVISGPPGVPGFWRSAETLENKEADSSEPAPPHLLPRPPSPDVRESPRRAFTNQDRKTESYASAQGVSGQVESARAGNSGHDPPRKSPVAVPPSRVVQTEPAAGRPTIDDGEKANQKFAQGREFYWKRRYEAARQAFSEAVRHDPTSALHYYFLGLAQYQLGQVDEAKRSVRTAVELEERHPVADWGRIMERCQGRARVWLEGERLLLRRGR